MVAPFASAPDGPTQTATGTSDRSMARTMSSTPASIAPDDFTWSTSSVDPRSLASADRVADERLVRRVEVALHLHDVDPAPAGRSDRAGVRRERIADRDAQREREGDERDGAPETAARSGLP